MIDKAEMVKLYTECLQPTLQAVISEWQSRHPDFRALIHPDWKYTTILMIEKVTPGKRLTDNDLYTTGTLATEIANLPGLHCSKCYTSGGYSQYYIKPDYRLLESGWRPEKSIN